MLENIKRRNFFLHPVGVVGMDWRILRVLVYSVGILVKKVVVLDDIVLGFSVQIKKLI